MDKDFKDTVWRARKDAHLVHHHIADFIINADDREHPPKLARLVAKYRRMMDEAERMQPAAPAP